MRQSTLQKKNKTEQKKKNRNRNRKEKEKKKKKRKRRNTWAAKIAKAAAEAWYPNIGGAAETIARNKKTRK